MPKYIIRDAAGKQLKDASIDAADVGAALDAARLFCSPLVLRGTQGSFGIYEGAAFKAPFTVNGTGTPTPAAPAPKPAPASPEVPTGKPGKPGK